MSDCSSDLKNKNVKVDITAGEVLLKKWNGDFYSDIPTLITSLKEVKQFLNIFFTNFIETKTISLHTIQNAHGEIYIEAKDQDTSNKVIQIPKAGANMSQRKWSIYAVQNKLENFKRLKKK